MPRGIRAGGLGLAGTPVDKIAPHALRAYEAGRSHAVPLRPEERNAHSDVELGAEVLLGSFEAG